MVHFFWLIFFVVGPRRSGGTTTVASFVVTPLQRQRRSTRLPLSASKQQMVEVPTSALVGVARRGIAKPLVWTVPALCGVAFGRGAVMPVGVAVALFQCVDSEARSRLGTNWKRCSKFDMVCTRPATAAFVGWLTNYVGVQMLFYPLQFRGIELVRRKVCSELGDLPSFGWFGWQGIVPAKAPRMARDLVAVVTNRLISVDATLAKLDPLEIAKKVDVAKLARATVGSGGPVEALGEAVWLGLSEGSKQTCVAHGRRLAVGVASDVTTKGAKGLDLTSLCVSALSGANVEKLVDLFQRVGRVELRLLVNSGIAVGLFLGFLQSLVSLLLAPKYGGASDDRPELPIVGLVGAGIVGAVTNWIALLWIFKPIDPINLGLFKLQGCFLKRQAEVSADFSKFFVDNILTARNLLGDLFQGPNSLEFVKLIRWRVAAFASGVARIAVPQFLGLSKDPDLIDTATSAIARQLPHQLPDSLFDYADAALDLETQIAEKMAAMPSSQFERLLHPIFEEDEATLIAVGGILGVVAAALQTKLQDWWTQRRRRRRQLQRSDA